MLLLGISSIYSYKSYIKEWIIKILISVFSVMSSEEPLEITAEDNSFDKDKFIEFFFTTDMCCPVAD